MTIAEFFASLPWTVWGVPMITGLCAVSGMAVKEHYSKLARKELTDQRTEDRRGSLALTLEQSQGHEITARFKHIMDGYERRIEDLMTELVACRVEIKDLRQAFDRHKDRCRGCPYVTGLEAADGTT